MLTNIVVLFQISDAEVRSMLEVSHKARAAVLDVIPLAERKLKISVSPQMTFWTNFDNTFRQGNKARLIELTQILSEIDRLGIARVADFLASPKKPLPEVAFHEFFLNVLSLFFMPKGARVLYWCFKLQQAEHATFQEKVNSFVSLPKELISFEQVIHPAELKLEMKAALMRVSSLFMQQQGELEIATTEIRKRGYSHGFRASLDPDSSDEEEQIYCRFACESLYVQRQRVWVETSLFQLRD